VLYIALAAKDDPDVCLVLTLLTGANTLARRRRLRFFHHGICVVCLLAVIVEGTLCAASTVGGGGGRRCNNTLGRVFIGRPLGLTGDRDAVEDLSLGRHIARRIKVDALLFVAFD